MHVKKSLNYQKLTRHLGRNYKEDSETDQLTLPPAGRAV